MVAMVDRYARAGCVFANAFTTQLQLVLQRERTDRLCDLLVPHKVFMGTLRGADKSFHK